MHVGRPSRPFSYVREAALARRSPAQALGWALLGLLAGLIGGFVAGLLRGPAHEDVSGTPEHEAAKWGAG